MKGPVPMTDDHKYVTLSFSTTDGEEHSVSLKRREYRTRRQMKDINNWVKKHRDSDGHDLLIYIVGMADKNIAKILEDGDVELAEYDRMLKEFSDASDADEVDNPEGESSASSAS